MGRTGVNSVIKLADHETPTFVPTRIWNLAPKQTYL